MQYLLTDSSSEYSPKIPASPLMLVSPLFKMYSLRVLRFDFIVALTVELSTVTVHFVFNFVPSVVATVIVVKPDFFAVIFPLLSTVSG